MSAEKAEGNPNPYKLSEEELTMPEGMSHTENVQWMENLAAFQLEGMLHGKIPQKPIFPPRFARRYSRSYPRNLLREYQKARFTTLAGPTDDSSPGKHTRPHFGSGAE